MKIVINSIFFIFSIIISFNTFGQKNSSDKLKREQAKLENSIAVTKSLLRKTKKNSQATISQLRVLENQLKFREELLANYEDQIKTADLEIEKKEVQITELENRLKVLVKQYKYLLIYAYKHRSKSGQWMYIFAAKNYNDAIKRKKYLEKVAELQRKQKLLIEQHKNLISKEKIVIEKDKKQKEIIADEKRLEKENLEKDKLTKQASLDKLKKEESRLTSDMKLKENRRAILKQRIREAINAEIAAEEVRRKAKEEKERKKLEEKNKNVKTEEKSSASSVSSNSTSKSTNTTENKKVITISETKEVELNQHFESNKGRLPWPVSSGTITEGYGKNPHPKMKGLFTNNNGIDITTNQGSNVRAVFEGEVTSVLSIPGAGKVVIIKHGNYRTVYSNLKDVFVSVGSKVKTKQAIGSLLPDDDDAISIAHFEIHQVSNGQINRINPSVWITR